MTLTDRTYTDPLDEIRCILRIPDASPEMLLCGLIGRANARRLTLQEMTAALDLIGEIRRDA